MEEDIKEIKEKLEEFMKRYNVTLEITTILEGRTLDDKIVNPKTRIIINS